MRFIAIKNKQKMKIGGRYAVQRKFAKGPSCERDFMQKGLLRKGLYVEETTSKQTLCERDFFERNFE